jgi:hypothetical protein
MSDVVYTDPALAASKVPFNSPYIVLTQQQNSSLQSMIDKFPKPVTTPGTGAWANPGRFPSLAALFTQAAGFYAAYKAVGTINAANEALYQEAKKLKCETPFNYEIYYDKNMFVGIAPKGRASIMRTGAEIVPTTIVGTNCPRRPFPNSYEDEEMIKLIKEKMKQIKKDTKK